MGLLPPMRQDDREMTTAGDSKWRDTDGSFPGLIERVREGVGADLSSTGVPMPPMGGARLTEDQLEAIAAYAWSLRLP